MELVGKIVSGLKVRGVLKSEVISLPEAVSCRDIADTRHEVATPETIRKFEHAAPYAHNYPAFDNEAPMVLLIGRDCPRAMFDQKLTETFPYVVDSPLGFALVGETCPKSTSKPITSVNPCKTDLCPINSVSVDFNFGNKAPNIEDVFQETPEDEELGLSQDSKEFLSILNVEHRVDEDGNLELPLPFKESVKIPNNSAVVFKRTENALNRLRKNPSKLDACVKNMQHCIDQGYIEQVPMSKVEDPDAIYIPVHDVTHPKKGKTRMVFDASFSYRGVSLNDALLQGPNLINEMSGVFLRFRESPVAFSCDIQDMFYNFRVPANQRDKLRFYWFDDNDPHKEIVSFRAKTHLFGLTSSPGVANYALKLCAMRPLTQEFEAAQNFILESFYVDDGINSTENTQSGIKILCNTMALLKNYNVRLHKIMSNDEGLLNHFPESERAQGSSRPLDETSLQRVLGTSWNTKEDTLSLDVEVPNRPFTKRGILSCIGSIYDRMGLVGPVTLAGRLMQRKIMPPKTSMTNPLDKFGWDDKLPDEYFAEYDKWLTSLQNLSSISIPRCLVPKDFKPARRELHVFSDASDDAIGYVAYLRTISEGGSVHVAFVNANSKVAPRSATSIPRMELNAAVEAAVNASMLIREMKHKPDEVFLYTDSLIVMGYLRNKEKRFARYVERRVQLILHHTPVSWWHYVSTNLNPADIATRPHTPDELCSSIWFTGPEALWCKDYQPESIDLRNFGHYLPEVKLQQVVLRTSLNESSPVFKICTRFSSYPKVIQTVNLFNNLAHLNDLKRQQSGILLAPRAPSDYKETELFIIKAIQSEVYNSIIQHIKRNKSISPNERLSPLSPYLDDEGMLRVGGRLRNATIPFSEQHPVILPNQHPFTELLVMHHHSMTKHQGGYLTHALLRQNGIYVEKGKSLVRRIVGNCVVCRKLRADAATQLMADLPADRVEETAPFTNVGIDVFGHFEISEGKNTRRHTSTKKVWVLILVCLPSRAVHLEPLPAMDTATFLNALTRFFSIRGPCKIVRSDQGSNFLGAINQMEAIDLSTLEKQLKALNIKWILNPPHASHMGGTWERKIASVRRVLDATFATMGPRKMTYDEFSTTIAQASSIVNQTPLWVTLDDPNDPIPLTPAMLLTLRTENDVVSEEFDDRDLLAYGKQRHRRVQYLSDQFWIRWRREYLLTLTERHKWKVRNSCIAVDDVVLVRDKQRKRNDWPMGRVSSVKQSSDGLVRSVTIQLSSKTKEPRFLTRPISELVLLVPSASHSCQVESCTAAARGSVASVNAI